MTISDVKSMREIGHVVDENPDAAEFLITGDAAQCFTRRVYGPRASYRGDWRGVREGECGNVTWQKVDMQER